MVRAIDSATSLSEQACHWWVVLHAENASSTDHQEFGEWVARSPERVEAYLQTARLMRSLKSRHVRWPSTPADVLISMAKASPPEALQLARSGPMPRESLTPSLGIEERQSQYAMSSRDRWTSLTFRPLSWAIALTSALAVGFFWLIFTGPQQLRTEFGEQRSVLLDDGSRVTLNTASKIEVDLRAHRRFVRLVEGEALFEVAHDVTRPFDVQAGNTVFRAVGTQFDVDLRPSRTTLTVVEGRVAVVPSSDATPSLLRPPRALLPLSTPTESKGKSRNSSVATTPAPKASLILAASERVIVTETGVGAPEHVANIATATSWTRGQLVFEHRPLSEVTEEFNRYNRGHIVLASTELQRQEVTGVLQSNDSVSFRSFLANIPGVEIREASNGDYIVTSSKVNP